MWRDIMLEDVRAWARISSTVRIVDGRPVRDGYYHNYAAVRHEWDPRRIEYMQAVWVPTLSCPLQSRLGEAADGGKWVCGVEHIAEQAARNQSCLVYSFGSNNQFGFEEELLRRLDDKCEVHVFDHTVTTWTLPNTTNRIHTHGYAITSEADAKVRGKPYMSYDQIRNELGHANRSITILKIDIEGSEYEVLPDVLRNTNALPDQILVETHMSPDARASVGATDELLYLFRNASYHMFHMEPNFYGSSCCNEYSFLRLDRPRVTP
jgi:hypothetical protein